jgi:putative tryptophan/tyrosine transport system substrate-binding protein
MKRRKFITLLGGAAAMWPLAVRAQQFRRIGVLVSTGTTDPSYLAAFVQALRKFGWVDGQNLRLDIRWHENDPARARAFATELVAIDPDVILTAATSNLAILHGSTRTIPIVFLQVSDPVAQGFITSLARPGGNITGFTAFESAMGGKWLDLLKQISPDLARVAVLFHPQSPQSKLWVSSVETAGASVGIEVMAAPVRDAAEVERSIERLASRPNGGLIFPTDGFLTLNSKLVVDLAMRHRLPSVSAIDLHLTNGALMYYGYVRLEQYRQAAVYVDRILRGAKPGDLPIQAPTRFELMINLKTAKALGIEVPMGLMLRADELVE